MKFVVLTCLWGRLPLADYVLGCFARHRVAGVNLDLLAVGSEGEASRSVVQRHGFRYLEHFNQPLGSKWNAGLAACRGLDADAVVIVGSDDILNRQYFETAERVMGAVDYFGLLDLWFWDLPTGRFGHWGGFANSRRGEPIGLGRCLSRDLLDRLGWRLWEPRRKEALDRNATATIARAKPRSAAIRCTDHGISAIDIKTPANMWSFDQQARSGQMTLHDRASHWVEHYLEGWPLPPTI